MLNRSALTTVCISAPNKISATADHALMRSHGQSVVCAVKCMRIANFTSVHFFFAIYITFIFNLLEQFFSLYVVTIILYSIYCIENSAAIVYHNNKQPYNCCLIHNSNEDSEQRDAGNFTI